MDKDLKITIIGAASSYTPELISQLIIHYDSFKVTEICLMDQKDSLERLEIIGKFSKRLLKHHGKEMLVTTTTDRLEALKDASFVLIQIRTGKMDSRMLDESIPLEFGLIGHETIGLGGHFNALRTVPIIYEIIEDIKEVCPQAWVINVTNPTGIITEAVFRFAEFERFIGICSDPNETMEHLVESLDVPKSDIVPYFAGLNDLSFILKVYHKKKDRLKELIDKGYLTKYSSFDQAYIKQLGVYPHPNLKFYYQYDETYNMYMNSYAKGLTRANEVMDIEHQLFELYQDENLVTLPLIMKKRHGHDYAITAVKIMDSIKNNRKDYHVINTVNRGHIIGIPDECAIEITCRITSNGPIPVHIGELPIQVRGIVQHLKAYEELLCDAIYEKDLKKALMAIQIHPLSTSFSKTKQAFDKLFEVHKKHLAYYGDYQA